MASVASIPHFTDETVLRLSCRPPVERAQQFDRVFQQTLLPQLEAHGFAACQQAGRPTAVGFSSRLVQAHRPDEAMRGLTALRASSQWQTASGQLGADVQLHAYHLPLGAGDRSPASGSVVPAGPGRVRQAGLGSRRGAWQNFDITDGFPGTAIAAMVQDRHGVLWFATWSGGLCRYDGVEVVTFTTADGLPGNGVRDLCEDGDGCLWLATDGGICCYNGTQFVTYGTAEGLASDDVTSLCPDADGGLWFGFAGGTGAVCQLHHDVFTTWRHGAFGAAVRGICPDGGSLWLATDRGACRLDGSVLTTFTVADGLADDRVVAMHKDRSGSIWFATRAGVSRFDGSTMATYTTAQGLADDSVWDICQDREGALWFGTWSGVSRFDGDNFTNYTDADGLEGTTVGAICEDHEGNLWFGTGLPRLELVGTGVSRLGAQCRTFTAADGLADDHVVALSEDAQGTLWIGTWKGVSRWDGQTFATLTGLQANVRCIAHDTSGNTWFGTYFRGAFRFDGQQLTRHTVEHGLADNTIEAILQDRQGIIWFGTEAGVSRYEDGNFSPFPLGTGRAVEVRSICQDQDGNIWFATSGSGLWRYDGVRLRNFGTEDGLTSPAISCVLEDRDGCLWAGTRGAGICRFDGTRFQRVPSEYLPDAILSMMQDRQGHFWFCSYGAGVHRFDGLVVQTLHQRNGLANNGVQRALQDRHGDVWIATEGGLTRYRPQHTPPTVRLMQILGDRERGPVRHFTLPTSHKRLTIRFRGRSYKTGRDHIAYAYRMDGVDDDWRWTRQEEAVYTDLTPGDFTFRVCAVDRDLDWSEPAEVAVQVVPDERIAALTEALNSSGAGGEFVGTSAALQRVQARLAQVAVTDLSVLILGETGTGKGLAARTVHSLSDRRGGPFIQVNCGALPEGLVESELFGHEKGAFTGAVARRVGKVELAAGGTLFLDEIGDMSADAQVKLLRLLEERQFERVGGTRTHTAQVRVIAATNRDLRQMVAAGTFREDLFFRLQVFPAQLPPLRERGDDIPLLATYFMERMAAHLHKDVARLTPESHAALRAYRWPGNVRELEHVIQRAVVVCSDDTIRPADLGLDPVQPASSPDESESLTLEEAQRRHIRRTLTETGGVIKGPQGAAARLGLPASSLYYRMKKLGISGR